MFWGLIMEPQKRYTQTVKKAFHISHAAMDTATGDGEVCQVMVAVDGKNFLMCTLQKAKTIQTPLDLFFREGDKISFITNGKSHVHLTGYLDPDLEEELEGEDEEDDVGFEDEDVPSILQAPTQTKKDKKRKHEEESSSPPAQLTKKQRKELARKKREEDAKKANKNEGSDSEASSDDDGMDVRKLLEEDADTDENDDSYLPNESTATVDDEDSDDDEDEEEDDDDDSDENSTPQSTPNKRDQKKQQQTPQQNGHSDKKKKGKEAEKENKAESVEKSPATLGKDKKVLAGNVAIEDLKIGSGAVAKSGKMVSVFYEGRLKNNNKMFDSCSKNPAFKFRLGKKEVISGWDVGIIGMKVGGKRRVVCPPGMAYGNKGSPPIIPPNATLIFEVELKGVN